MKIACNIDSSSPAFFFLRFFFWGIETPRYFTQFVANRSFYAILFLPPPSVWPWDAFCPKRRRLFFSPEKRGGNRHFFLPFSSLFLGKSGDREEGEEEEEEMHLSALRIPKGEDTRYIQKYFFATLLGARTIPPFFLRVPFQPHHVSSIPPTFDWCDKLLSFPPTGLPFFAGESTSGSSFRETLPPKLCSPTTPAKSGRALTTWNPPHVKCFQKWLRKSFMHLFLKVFFIFYFWSLISGESNASGVLIQPSSATEKGPPE